MKTVDSRNNWKLVDELLETETDEWRRHMLAQLKEHVRAECGSDHAALMETLSDNARFHIWSATEDTGPKGREAVNEFYAGLIASGSNLNHFLVQNVLEQSPAAEAGLQKGDQVLSINRWNCRFYDLSHLNRKFQKKVGKKIRLKIKRNGEKKVYHFRLRDLI